MRILSSFTLLYLLTLHSCRVIQKAIRCLEPEQACRLIEKFHGKVMSFIYDPNGNHVIQRSIQVISTFSKLEAEHGNIDAATDISDKMQFIIDDIVANTKALSAHRYGCRVVQRAIEHCTEVQKNVVLENIIDCHITLIMDQYGEDIIVACCESNPACRAHHSRTNHLSII